MKERPILFSGPMVRATIEGRKTQTRRVMKRQPEADWGMETFNDDGRTLLCPYGVPGDRLWVRETFSPDWCDHTIYRADGGSAKDAGYRNEPRWKPSIFMPRHFSRITLEITKVRVERLQDISEEDAIAEGIFFESRDVSLGDGGKSGYRYAPDSYAGTARHGYQLLWDSINGKKHPWESNPWVWCLSFQRLP